VAGVSAEEIQEALWDLVWAGEATNDAFAPLRSGKLTTQASQRARRTGPPRRAAASAPAAPPRSRPCRAAGR
jgi:ATP-dependent Lhr-like helicase